MTKIVGAVVRNGRTEADAPPDWPDGTEVHISLECRSNLTADDSPCTGAEVGVIWELIAKENDHALRAGAVIKRT